MNDRIAKLTAALPADFEAALIMTQPNLFYLLDFDTEGAGALLLAGGEAYFIIDSRYIEVAQRQVQQAHVHVILETNRLDQVADLLAQHSAQQLYLEDAISLRSYGQLKAHLEKVALVSDSVLLDTLRSLRSVKDEEEIRRVRQAQAITDDCFTYICGQLRPGMRQIDAALLMETYLRSHGASGLAFPSIFISGADTSMPHGVPGDHQLAEGDFITMDYGARCGGYCTDMTRTVALGSITPKMDEVYHVVLEAQLAACAAIRPGVPCDQIDAVARDIIAKAGYGAYFGHGLGHSVGVEIHEEPRFSPVCHAVTRPGQLVTVEPGIYLPGQFGVRIEDTVLVTEDGCEILGKSTKNLIIL